MLPTESSEEQIKLLNHPKNTKPLKYHLLIQRKKRNKSTVAFKFLQHHQNLMSIKANLPIHFFTIILDGEPYIRYHIDVLNALEISWHWHIIEGVADLNHDTSWSKSLGGKVPNNRYDSGRSSDGTSEYLDEIAKDYPDHVSIYRKPIGHRWDGKIEMIRAPLLNITTECLLWQIDSDELWKTDQIHSMHHMFCQAPDRYAAYFWCHYFVGPDKIIATRNCYAQNPQFEWLRVWRYKPGMFWISHEPPTLANKSPDKRICNVESIHPFTHSETEEAGLVFQHMSYTTEAQLRFKEEYYGYTGATKSWQELQQNQDSYILLRKYFTWVTDSTLVENIQRLGIQPLHLEKVKESQTAIQSTQTNPATKIKIRIAIDGVFFQLNNTGIARLWKAILSCWARSGVINEVLLLDRGSTMPKISGANYCVIPKYHIGMGTSDRDLLQQILDHRKVPLFASTYYTTVPHTNTIQLVYDLIPEVLEFEINKEPEWIEKHFAFNRANHFVCISKNTERDLLKFFPKIPSSASEVIYCGVDQLIFFPPTIEDISSFYKKHNINKPYFLLIGSGSGYKNGIMLVEALSQISSKTGFEILLATKSAIPEELASAAAEGILRKILITDAELCSAYGGAVALVYPSTYEGFGLPILKAMACNCPVICNTSASLPEVAGDAAIYASNPQELAIALCEVQKPNIRLKLIEAGRDRVKMFSWETAAEKLWQRILLLTSKQI